MTVGCADLKMGVVPPHQVDPESHIVISDKLPTDMNSFHQNGICGKTSTA